MSTTSLSFHRVVGATAEVNHVNSTHWLELEFTDDTGARVNVTLFCETPEALLQSLTTKEPEAA